MGIFSTLSIPVMEGDNTSHTQSGASSKAVASGSSGMPVRRQPARSGALDALLAKLQGQALSARGSCLVPWGPHLDELAARTPAPIGSHPCAAPARRLPRAARIRKEGWGDKQSSCFTCSRW
jgi:hypothetical protein